MVSVLCDLVRYGLPPAPLSSRQAKKEIATRTEPFNSPGFRPSIFDVSVTRDDPGARGAVKQGADERSPLRHPDGLIEIVRVPPTSGPPQGEDEGGAQSTNGDERNERCRHAGLLLPSAKRGKRRQIKAKGEDGVIDFGQGRSADNFTVRSGRPLTTRSSIGREQGEPGRDPPAAGLHDVNRPR